METIDFDNLEKPRAGSMSSVLSEDSEVDDDDVHACACCVAASSSSDGKKQPIPLFYRFKVVISTCNYGMLAMCYILLDETLPLFLKLDSEDGGFSFNSTQIGFLMSVSGVFMLLFTSKTTDSIY